MKTFRDTLIYILIFFILLALVSWVKSRTLLASAHAAEVASLTQWVGRVVAVTDGDTLKVVRDEEHIRVRLYGIDAPEKNQPGTLELASR